jgi:SAM-dependent methyltransferase
MTVADHSPSGSCRATSTDASLMTPLARERSKLFDEEAERYDRYRPTYPDALIDDLLGPTPQGINVLDVACGTGIASRLMAARGAQVLGVEVAPRMAEIARRHGIDVEIGAFEDWEPAGRTFDGVTSAQAWHWLDLPVATAKAASVLRPWGRLGLIWNCGAPPDDLADALAEVYAFALPDRVHTVFRGYGINRSTDGRPDSPGELAAIAAVRQFDIPTETWFPWTHTPAGPAPRRARQRRSAWDSYLQTRGSSA